MIGIQESLKTLKDSEQVGYVLDPSLSLVYRNEAWNRFALQNGAPELASDDVIGTNLKAVIDESLRPFYLEALGKVTREKKVWEWEYECSSHEVFRKHLMRVYPLEPEGWLLLIHSTLVESEHPTTTHAPLEQYVNEKGQIRMCVHCRCSQRAVSPAIWDFVPAHLQNPGRNITHGLCPICRDYFYPSGTL